MASRDQRELQDLKLHKDELRRLNGLLESNNASLTRQLRESTDEQRRSKAVLHSTTQELQRSNSQVQVLKSRLVQRDGEALRAQYRLRNEEREHAMTKATLSQLANDSVQLGWAREILDAEREEMDTERREFDDEKEDFDYEKAELEEAQGELEEAQEKLEEEQEELETEQAQLDEDQKELEEEREEIEGEREEIAAEREEMGEEIEAWRLRSKALEKRVNALSALLTPYVAEGVKQVIPVPPAPDADIKTMKRKAHGLGGYNHGYKRARW